MSKRSDAIGLFWEDVAVVRAVKEVVKRTPPERTWESPDYLPGLEDALCFMPDLFTDYELGQAAINGETLIFDSEVNPNYALFAFRSTQSRKVVYFEIDDDPNSIPMNCAKMAYVLENFCIVNFNGRKFDFVITALALAGCSSEQLWLATKMLIEFQQRPQDVLKHFRVKKKQPPNQIDLIDLTALSPGLKVCAGRLHAKRMQDLPFLPGIVLSKNQRAITFMYCFNDLDNTELLYNALSEQIAVRRDTGKQYNLDLRSHSDPQMAEAIIASEIKRITGRKFLDRTTLAPDTSYRFQAPHFIRYKTPLLQGVLATVQNAVFWVSNEDGNIVMPKEIVAKTVDIAKCKYNMGIGGLHSTEKTIAHLADEDYFIADTDVTSYYPSLIVNAGITPENLGADFLTVYNAILEARVAAKRSGNSVVAECLKIVVNGSFGKLGSKYSIMYAPNLMIQVTLTGQLSLLMLIEMFELNGVEVISANTDGIVTRCLRSRRAEFDAIVKEWETITGFGTEETLYKAVYSRDVNNYIAMYDKPSKGKHFKTKGAYGATAPKKNAVTEICVDAACQLMLDGTPIMTTIKKCTNISKFTAMRAVKGGAVKVVASGYNPDLNMDSKIKLVRERGCVLVGPDINLHWSPPNSDNLTVMTLEQVYKWCSNATESLYLGKVIRWYYSTKAQGEIIYARTGNKVARTDNAKPCMDLPDSLPTDIDYDWYAAESYKILEEIGFATAPTVALAA